jgi:sialate O-acetylesterase
LHFHFVQLANHGPRASRPGWSYWAELREAQLRALVLRHTGMAVAIDIGDADDIHPKNKQDVGLRLALNALAKTYGRRMACSGPMFRRMTVRANRVTLEFSHTEGGLVARGGKLAGFAVAGDDGRFVWAKATLDVSRGPGHGADTVVVTHPRIRQPVAVRYGWSDNPDCTLFNGAGLPASPFRTDRWPEAGE